MSSKEIQHAIDAMQQAWDSIPPLHHDTTLPHTDLRNRAATEYREVQQWWQYLLRRLNKMVTVIQQTEQEQ